MGLTGVNSEWTTLRQTTIKLRKNPLVKLQVHAIYHWRRWKPNSGTRYILPSFDILQLTLLILFTSDICHIFSRLTYRYFDARRSIRPTPSTCPTIVYQQPRRESFTKNAYLLSAGQPQFRTEIVCASSSSSIRLRKKWSYSVLTKSLTPPFPC